MPPIKIKLSDAANSDQTKQADLNKEDNVVVTATHDSEVERRLAKFKSDYQSSFDNLIEAFISEKRELEGKLKSAQQQIVQLTSMSEKMELEEKLKSAQQEVMQLTEDIERIAGIQHRAPDLDNALESQFMDLREQVRSFTLNFCDRPISSPSTPLKLPARVKQALAAVSGVSTARLLSSALHARYFVQALIWRLLCDNLLTNPFLIWGQNEEVGNFVRRVQSSRKLPIHRQQFWRTVTGQILVEIATPRPHRTASWQKILVDTIGPLVRAEHKDNIEEHIRQILDKAIELAKNLAQSRTGCVVQRKGPGADDSFSQKYDDIWMEVVEKALESYEDIDFLVTPALIQLTNSGGEAFKHPRVMVKAEVCFGRGRLPASNLSSNKDRETATTLSQKPS